MTDTTHKAPERIKVWPTYDGESNDWSNGFWNDTEEPIGTLYVRADLVQAAVAAALREAISRVNGCDRISEVQPAILALIREGGE
jgi:hypothetical protein